MSSNCPSGQTNFERGKHKMKKIIALVLFATMLFAFVPAANAAVTDGFTVTVLTGETGLWYAQQRPEYLSSGEPSGNGGTIGLDQDPNGIAVSFSDKVYWKKADFTTDVTKTETITINLKGSFKEAEAHWYTANTNGSYGQLGKVVKIPYTVVDENDINITGTALLDGYKNYNKANLASSFGQPYYYIDFILAEDDYSEDYYVSYGSNGRRVKITVKWDNTDNNTTKDGGPYVTMKVVGYTSDKSVNAQFGNYTVKYEDMKNNSDGKKVIGKMTFNIAAFTKADRSAIWQAAHIYDYVANSIVMESASTTAKDLIDKFLGLDSAKMTLIDEYYTITTGQGQHQTTTAYYRSSYSSDAAFRQAAGNRTIYRKVRIDGKEYVYDMNKSTADVRLKAFDIDGTVFEPGTVISVGQIKYNTGSVVYESYSYVDPDSGKVVFGYDKWIGRSSKYVDTEYNPAYLIDNAGCFVFVMPGIVEFAASAGLYTDLQGNTRKDTSNNAYVDQDIVLYYQNQLQSMQLIFTRGKIIRDVEFSVYFQNVERSKAQVIIADNEITIPVGWEGYLPYELDDYYAMSVEFVEEWTSMQESIVKVTDKKDGKIKGLKVGTAYVYAKDPKGTFQLFIVNVVDPSAEVEVNTGVKTYVVTASNLNVRTGPGTSYSKLGMLKRGTEIEGIEVEGSVWVQVNYGGKTAYVSGKYLAEK